MGKRKRVKTQKANRNSQNKKQEESTIVSLFFCRFALLVSPVNLFTEALASVGDVDGYAHLNAKLAADQQEQVRDSVVGLLAALNDDGKVVPLLRKALTADPSITVRTTAAASLVHFRDASG